jgi:hypothetical protein
VYSVNKHSNNESEYHRKIEQEIQLINQLVKNKAIHVATLSELEKSIKSINTGKSADIYNITSCDIHSHYFGYLLLVVESVL